MTSGPTRTYLLGTAPVDRYSMGRVLKAPMSNDWKIVPGLDMWT